MKKRLLLLILLPVFALKPSFEVSSVGAAAVYVINDVTVIDGTGKPARPHMRVTVRDRRLYSWSCLVHTETR